MKLTRHERKAINRAVAADLEIQILVDENRLMNLKIDLAKTRLAIAELEIHNAALARFYRDATS